MTARKTAVLGMLMAAGILLQLLESFVPVVMIVPGYKIGLANIVGLAALYLYGPKDMVIVTSGRIVLASLLTGTIFSVAFILSVTGGILSMAVMALTYKTRKFSIYGVSVAGAAAHSLGQVAAITVIYQQYFMQMFAPILLALSIVSGLLTALVARLLLKRVRGVRHV